jgi:hypothetical protein
MVKAENVLAILDGMSGDVVFIWRPLIKSASFSSFYADVFKGSYRLPPGLCSAMLVVTCSGTGYNNTVFPNTREAKPYAKHCGTVQVTGGDDQIAPSFTAPGRAGILRLRSDACPGHTAVHSFPPSCLFKTKRLAQGSEGRRVDVLLIEHRLGSFSPGRVGVDHQPPWRQ